MKVLFAVDLGFARDAERVSRCVASFIQASYGRAACRPAVEVAYLFFDSTRDSGGLVGGSRPSSPDERQFHGLVEPAATPAVALKGLADRAPKRDARASSPSADERMRRIKFAVGHALGDYDWSIDYMRSAPHVRDAAAGARVKSRLVLVTPLVWFAKSGEGRPHFEQILQPCENRKVSLHWIDYTTSPPGPSASSRPPPGSIPSGLHLCSTASLQFGSQHVDPSALLSAAVAPVAGGRAATWVSNLTMGPLRVALRFHSLAAGCTQGGKIRGPPPSGVTLKPLGWICADKIPPGLCTEQDQMYLSCPAERPTGTVDAWSRLLLRMAGRGRALALLVVEARSQTEFPALLEPLTAKVAMVRISSSRPIEPSRRARSRQRRGAKECPSRGSIDHLLFWQSLRGPHRETVPWDLADLRGRHAPSTSTLAALEASAERLTCSRACSGRTRDWLRTEAAKAAAEAAAREHEARRAALATKAEAAAANAGADAPLEKLLAAYRALISSSEALLQPELRLRRAIAEAETALERAASTSSRDSDIPPTERVALFLKEKVLQEDPVAVMSVPGGTRGLFYRLQVVLYFEIHLRCAGKRGAGSDPMPKRTRRKVLFLVSQLRLYTSEKAQGEFVQDQLRGVYGARLPKTFAKIEKQMTRDKENDNAERSDNNDIQELDTKPPAPDATVRRGSRDGRRSRRGGKALSVLSGSSKGLRLDPSATGAQHVLIQPTVPRSRGKVLASHRVRVVVPVGGTLAKESRSRYSKKDGSRRHRRRGQACKRKLSSTSLGGGSDRAHASGRKRTRSASICVGSLLSAPIKNSAPLGLVIPDSPLG